MILAIDPGHLLGVSNSCDPAFLRTLLIRNQNQGTGLLVDGVAGILRLLPDTFTPLPEDSSTLCSAVAVHEGRQIYRLDLDALLREIDSQLGKKQGSDE